MDVHTKIYVTPDSEINDVFSKKHNNSPVSEDSIDKVSDVAIKSISNNESSCCVIQ